MFVTTVNIRREGYYGAGYGKADPEQPFNCTIEVHGQHGKVELKISPEMSARIIDVIAEEVAAAGKATAEAMTASFLNAASPKQIAA